MRDPSRRQRGIIVHSFLAITALGVTIYLLWALRTLILPIILGILLAYLFRPFKTAFKYRWIPWGIRVGILFFLLTSSLFFGIRFVKDNIPNEEEKLEILVRMKYHFNEKFNKMMDLDSTTGKGNGIYKLISKDINPLRESFNNFLELTPEQKEMFLSFNQGVEGYKPVPKKYYDYFLANNKGLPQALKKGEGVTLPPLGEKGLPDQKSTFLKTLVNIFSIWFLLPIVFLFFLVDGGSFAQFYIRMVPNRYFELALTVKEEVDLAIGKYLRGVSVECTLVGFSTAAGLFIIGVPFGVAALIGIMTCLTTAIPFLGPIVTLTLSLGFTLTAEEIHPLFSFVNIDNLFLAVLIVVGIVLTLDKIIFQPLVLGGALNLHPLILILGAMAGSMLFGIAGVILAVPAIVVLKVFIRHSLRGLKDYRII